MNESVLGWVVTERGEVYYMYVETTNHPEVFKQEKGWDMHGRTYTIHLLNKDFFLDKTLALRKGIEKLHGEMGRIAQQIEDYNLKIKELEDAARG